MLIIRLGVILLFGAIFAGHLAWDAFSHADNYQSAEIEDDDEHDEAGLS